MAPKVSGMFQEAANRPRGIEDFERVSLGFGVITGCPQKWTLFSHPTSNRNNLGPAGLSDLFKNQCAKIRYCGLFEHII